MSLQTHIDALKNAMPIWTCALLRKITVHAPMTGN